MTCNWSSGSQKIAVSTKQFNPPTLSISRKAPTSNVQGELPRLIEDELHGYIVSFCMKFYLPIQVHKYPDVEETDQSHIVSMSYQSPALMDVLLANAALAYSDSPCWRSFAIASYLRAVRGVRIVIEGDGFKTGGDSLVATLMWLCIYEVSPVFPRAFDTLLTRCCQNSRLDTPCSQSATHLGAFAELLHLRAPVDRTQSSIATRSFERICVEYYIYHSAIIMLFDQTVEPATSVNQLHEKYHTSLTTPESNATPNVIQSPVFGTRPELFTSIINLTGMARETSSLEVSDYLHWQYIDLVKWQKWLDVDEKTLMRGGKLYEMATRLLLLFVLASTDEDTADHQEQEIKDVIQEALSQLRIQPFGRIFGKYWLWPLAILGSAMTRHKDINLIRDKMDAIAERSNCNAIKIVRYVLESNWANNPNIDRSSYSLSGLAALLDGDVIQSTSSLLLSYKHPIR